MDKLKQVLNCIESRVSILESKVDWPVIRLFSWRTLSPKHYESIRHFQMMIQQQFRVNLVVIGGGYGCSKVVFAVEAHTQEEASAFVINIMESPVFRELASKAEFRVAITDNPYTRTDLKTGDQELSPAAIAAKNKLHIKELNIMTEIKNTITNIEGGVKDTNLAICSENNTMQLSYNPDNTALMRLLDSIKVQITSKSDIAQGEKSEAIDIVEAIDTESKKDKPKKALLKSYAESLKSISSITDSVTKLLALLGLGG